jgi:thioredoxin 1
MIELKKFYLPNCKPCQNLQPVLEETVSDYPDAVSLQELDVEKEYEEAMKYSVKTVPTVVFVKDEEEIGRIRGVGAKERYAKIIDKYL